MANIDGLGMLQGHVERDEAHGGGRRPGQRGRGAAGGTIAYGMKARGGRMTTEVVPDVRMKTLGDATLRNVEPGSTMSTDALASYGLPALAT